MKSTLRLLALVALCAASSCAKRGPSKPTEVIAEKAAEGEPLSTTSTLGPVTATVTLSPASPLIGDIMDLSLEVVAAKGVRVVMPKFQEAFSRFSVEDYNDEQADTDKGSRLVQRYRLHASVSGRLRVPPLRVVFFDERAESETGDQEQELLTEELSLTIRPVLTGEEASKNELRSIRRPLEEKLGPSPWQQYWWAFLAGGAVLMLFGAWYVVRRGRSEPTISPYERASVALAMLEQEGLPDEETLEMWYVRLSGIVRRYLEDRFSLRAPELTTEEFLRVAQRSILLSNVHKKLLQGFLADCDQVKFAGYEPGAEESQGVLETARRFLLETRLVDDPENSPAEPPTETRAEEAA